MPKLIRREDGSVVWDYDAEPEPARKASAKKKAASKKPDTTTETKE